MVEQDSWESKKQEVWQRIVGAEDALKGLNEKLSAVETIANNKISENEQTAVDSAKKASDGAAKVVQAVLEAEELFASVTTFKQKFTEATNNIALIKNQTTEATANAQSIATAKAASETATKEITVLQEKAKKSAEDAEAKWATTNQQVQNIATLNAQASGDAATAKTARESVENLQKEVSQVKSDIIKMQADWEKEFESLQAKHDKSLAKLCTDREQELSDLINEKTQELTELNEKYSQEFDLKKTKIESLLPGATSAGLASAFAKRRLMFYITKFGWGLLLIISVLCLISFGGMIISPNFYEWLGLTILPTDNLGNNWYGRAIVFAALVLFEEFARRNFNIVSRLEEAYAYKEVIARSYLGYKEQMEGIKWPQQAANAPENNSTSILVKVFMNQLADEPGKHVFDKEKHVVGPGAIIDGADPSNPESAVSKTIQACSKGELLNKISWPIVAVVAILAIAGCIIAYLLKGHVV